MPLAFAIVDNVSIGWSASFGVVCQRARGTGVRRGTYIILYPAGWVPGMASDMIGEQSATEWPVGVEQDAVQVTRREALTNTQ